MQSLSWQQPPNGTGSRKRLQSTQAAGSALLMALAATSFTGLAPVGAQGAER